MVRQHCQAVSVWYEFDYDNRPIGLLWKWIHHDYSDGGTSVDITTIDKRDFIEAGHLFDRKSSRT